MVVFVADEFANNSTLVQNLGTSHKLGGAEQDDAAMLWYVSQVIGDIPKVSCRDLVPDPDEMYLIANFATMPEATKQQLEKYGNYMLYEHDHKYCLSRNPSFFNDFKVPVDQLCNLSFYKDARLVMCMTKFHQDIVARNVRCKLDNIGGSFWTNEEFDLIGKLRTNKKNEKAFVYDNVSPHKGLSQSEDYCLAMGITYDKLPNQETRTAFLSQMSQYSRLVFMPQSPETCSRLVVEAKMMDLIVTTTRYVGAIHEPWFRLQGQELIDHLKNVVTPMATNKIVSCLTRIL